MKWIIRIVALAILAGLGFWLWTVFFPDPEKVIRREIAQLALDASFTPNEGELTRLDNATRLASHFSSDAELVLESLGHGAPNISGRDQIIQASIAGRAVAGSLKVEFPDVVITFPPGKESATADVTVHASALGDPNAVVEEMRFALKKIDGHWLITRVEPVKTLR